MLLPKKWHPIKRISVRLTPWLRRNSKRLAVRGLIVGLVLVLGILLVHGRVMRAGDGRVFMVTDSARRVPAHRVAIIFGARVYASGKLSQLLEKRLQAGLTLYKQGTVKKILVSGDNRWSHYNEPEVMRAWLIASGVAPEDVVCDFAGRRTLDTCARANKLWRIDSAILVTQAYHLPRALYLAKAWGIDAIGVRAEGFVGRRDRTREFCARILAWLDVNITQREPALWGRLETI